MRQLLIATSLLACSSLASAGQLISSDRCSVEMRGQVQFGNQVLSIGTEQGDKIRITPDHQLSVNGELLSLSRGQQRLVTDYYQGVAHSIPMAADIATDAVALAGEAISEVMYGLIGDNFEMDAISDKLQEIDLHIQDQFYADNQQINFDLNNFDDQQALTEQWSEEFQELVRRAVTSSIGHLLINLGGEMISAGGSPSNFVERMEQMGEQIEDKVEAQSAKLEYKADALCEQLTDLNHIEDRLQVAVPALATLDILQHPSQQNAM